MSISTYADLQNAITNWLKRSDLTTSIPDLIAVAERRIYRNLRVREMEEPLALTMAGGVLAVPSDYVNLRYAYISSTSPVVWLERKAPEWIYRNDPYRTQRRDIPKYIAREGANFIFAPYPSSDFDVSGIYYKRLDPIAATLNDIFMDNPDLWLFGALAESAPFVQNDARLPMWEAKFNRSLAEANSEEYVENASGGSLAMTSDFQAHP